MWIVTREINEYYQEGEYFVAAYQNKPSFQDLKLLLPDESDAIIGKLSRGISDDSDGQWYSLHEVKEGEKLKT